MKGSLQGPPTTVIDALATDPSCSRCGSVDVEDTTQMSGGLRRRQVLGG